MKNTIGFRRLDNQPMKLSEVKSLMGERKVIIIEEAKREIGLSLLPEVVKSYDNVPFLANELIVAKKWGMILVAMPSIVSLKEMLNEVNKDWLSVPDSLLELRTRVAGYMLLYPEAIGTKRMTLKDQIAKVSPRVAFESPLAPELAYADLVLARKYGKKLSRKELRCFDEPHHGSHVTVKINPGTFRVEIDEVDDQKKSRFLALAGCYFRPLPI